MSCNTCQNIEKCTKVVECKAEKFCYYCNYNYGDDECHNCTYYEELGDNKMNELVEELIILGFDNKQILTIIEILNIKKFEYRCGSIIFTIEDEMTIKTTKEILEKTIQILEAVEINVSTDYSNFSHLVFDIEC